MRAGGCGRQQMEEDWGQMQEKVMRAGVKVCGVTARGHRSDHSQSACVHRWDGNSRPAVAGQPLQCNKSIQDILIKKPTQMLL